MKAGILGGGQLGRMLLQEAANYTVETWVMEKDRDCPAAHLCHHFVQGDIRDFDAVYAFGQQVDVLTIEIENVNVEALEKLEAEGKTIIPRPSALKTIKNKILQKQYYSHHSIPSPAFLVTQDKAELATKADFLPAVHKLGMGGYDGRGVQLLKKTGDIENGFDAPSVLEKMVDIDKEIAITVAIDKKGAHVIYPPVEMIFDPYLNLLDYQLCPADIQKTTLWKAEAIALAVARNFGSPGIFAIEMFIDRSGDVWVNETAPRVHNSGHHTIEAHYSSQFDMLWRIMLDYPLGNTAAIMPSIMINILGTEGHKGNAVYEGLNEVLAMENAYVHLYGKSQTAPGRKMGHVTILERDKSDLLRKAGKVKKALRVIS
ncbi:MAG TPA: 5-(carboxyamino)imidazole ribonucleotide synthase [Chitinophagaceae bacterium]|nr:5-(carboxyamino)imidazole ribonucleotide synthase [Chitinophagaceae bacterium]